MGSPTVSVLCYQVALDQNRKLHAMAEFGNHKIGDIASILLEDAIDLKWEALKENPKYAKKIKAWEKDNEDK